MKIKDYLNQAHRLDQRINSKLEQIGSLYDLATKAKGDRDSVGGANRPYGSKGDH